MSQHVTPLEPDSPEGRATVERISPIFAQVRLGIAERRRKQQQAETREAS